MTVAPQADTEIVQGIVQGIVQKAADKWQIEVNVGQQNPRRLWTKDAALVQQMMGMIGHELAFMCGKSHWTNASNQPVTSLWINGYGQPGAVAQQPAPPPVFQQQQPAQFVQQQPVMQQPVQQVPSVPRAPQQITAMQKEERIMREAASKVACDMLKYLHPEEQSFENVLKISERLVHYYENGVTWDPEAVARAADDGIAPPHTDDDIPF